MSCVFKVLQRSKFVFFMRSCWIFFRPKYLQARSKYGRETRLWCVKRAIYGERIRPTRPTNNALTPRQVVKANQRIDCAGELEQVKRSTLPLAPNDSSTSQYGLEQDQEGQSQMPGGSNFFHFESIAESDNESVNAKEGSPKKGEAEHHA